MRIATLARVSLGAALFSFAACGDDATSPDAKDLSSAGGGHATAGAAGASGANSMAAGGSNVGGATGTGGTGMSDASATGAAGASGAPAIGTDGGSGSGGVKSMGCGLEPNQPLMTQTKYAITVGAAQREFFVWLPANYDKNRAYSTVFVGPGCSGSGDNTIPIAKASGDNAIVVGLQYSQSVTGRPCFMTESATSPELPYFDETVKQVEAKFCIDESHLSMEGFSSGSWLANLLGCARGNVLKAQGNASGCTPPLPTCTGPIPYMAVHDMGDGANKYSCGTANRDRMVKLNNCSMTTMPYDPGPGVMAPAGKTISCVQYQGCTAPVVFCTTTGLDHNDGSITGASTFGFWKFWSSLP